MATEPFMNHTKTENTQVFVLHSIAGLRLEYSIVHLQSNVSDGRLLLVGLFTPCIKMSDLYASKIHFGKGTLSQLIWILVH